MSNDHAWTEYAASYALGALDQDELGAFEAHLAECALCRSEVQSYKEVTGALGLAAPPRPAPPQLKGRILAQARQVRPIGSAAAGARPARKSAGLPWLVAAASLVAALGLSALYARERSARTLAENDAADTQTQLAASQAQAARNDSLLSTLLAPDVRTATLAAEGRPPSARLYLDQGRRIVVIAARDLPPAPGGRTYQLWGIAANAAPVSLGTFNTRADGTALITLPMTAGMRFDVSAVTEEPAGGSPQPTTQPFLVGNWSAL
ncbi:MAG: anti-sigma factor [Pseudomonas sp.]